MKSLNTTFAQIFKAFAFTTILVFSFLLSSTTNASAQYYNTGYNSKVEDYAAQLAGIKMREINPSTGYGAYARVIGWAYNSYTGVYTIKLEAYWKGKTSAAADYYGTAEIDGIMEVNSYNGNYTFSETWRNQQTKNTWTTQDTRQAVGTAAAAYLLYQLLKD